MVTGASTGESFSNPSGNAAPSTPIESAGLETSMATQMIQSLLGIGTQGANIASTVSDIRNRRVQAQATAQNAATRAGELKLEQQKWLDKKEVDIDKL